MNRQENIPDRHPPLTLLEMSEAAKKRVSVITQEFNRGFDFLINYPRSVTIFGSTQTKPEDLYYQKAERLAARIVRDLRYSVLTGGGPGIMEAANKGAFEAGGNSIGLTIEIPRGQIINSYLTDTVSFRYFFSRKVCLAFSAEAYVFFPGGFGTLDEFSEILTLIQTEKIRKLPVVLVGVSYWTPLMEFFKNEMLKEGKITAEDLNLILVTDDEEKIIEMIARTPVEVGIDYKDYHLKAGPDVITDRPITKIMEETGDYSM